MNQIELEKIADSFDRKKNGLIDLAEISAILKGQKIRRKYKTTATAKPLSDAEKIDMEVFVCSYSVIQCHYLSDRWTYIDILFYTNRYINKYHNVCVHISIKLYP